VREPRPLIPVPGAPGRSPSSSSDAGRDTAVDLLCAADAEGRLTLAELDERAGAALSARTICELAALIADLSGPWTPVPASASGFRRPRRPGWASRAPERWSVLQSRLAALYYPVSLSRSAAHGDKVAQRGYMPARVGPAGPHPGPMDGNQGCLVGNRAICA
jgi:hypothetical protein